MSEKNVSGGPIMRLFQVRAKKGRVDELAQKLATVSVEVVQNKPGNEGYFFARSVADDGDSLVFASFWSDLSAVKDRFGAEWLSSHLPDGYAELIEDCSVRHFYLSSGWHVNDL
ncbi:MAG TPA: antibiotic biosynthesis monooxygenase [Alphaproteobacteria bacterium]|jgi:quinol monooxygenase YgiN|nr:antibiotic biosynthesis monooxygenase [Alphaproteobacteria bacterium]